MFIFFLHIEYAKYNTVKKTLIFCILKKKEEGDMMSKDTEKLLQQQNEEIQKLKKELKQATQPSSIFSVLKTAITRSVHDFFVREDKMKNMDAKIKKLEKALEEKEDKLNQTTVELYAAITLGEQCEAPEATERESNEQYPGETINLDNKNSHCQQEQTITFPQTQEGAIRQYFGDINISDLAQRLNPSNSDTSIKQQVNNQKQIKKCSTPLTIANTENNENKNNPVNLKSKLQNPQETIKTEHKNSPKANKSTQQPVAKNNHKKNKAETQDISRNSTKKGSQPKKVNINKTEAQLESSNQEHKNNTIHTHHESESTNQIRKNVETSDNQHSSLQISKDDFSTLTDNITPELISDTKHINIANPLNIHQTDNNNTNEVNVSDSNSGLGIVEEPYTPSESDTPDIIDPWQNGLFDKAENNIFNDDWDDSDVT